MVNIRELTEQQARHAIDNGELPDQVTSSAKRVAVVLTQDWCPQWAAMESYLDKLDADGEATDGPIDVYLLLYNQVSYFREFLSFKENTWNNSLIPYVRYYREGQLVGESNYTPRDGFLKQF